MRNDSPDFRFAHSVPVRFKDIDLGGHSHHSNALVYFEEARSAYWREVAGRVGANEVDYILAEAEVRYHRRVLHPDTLRVEVRVSLLGRKHFVMEYRAFSGSGEHLLSGRTTLVMFDYTTSASTRIPDELRSRIEAFERGVKEGGAPEAPSSGGGEGREA
jgi:acyl-CoA thioester hydrolase